MTDQATLEAGPLIWCRWTVKGYVTRWARPVLFLGLLLLLAPIGLMFPFSDARFDELQGGALRYVFLGMLGAGTLVVLPFSAYLLFPFVRSLGWSGDLFVEAAPEGIRIGSVQASDRRHVGWETLRVAAEVDGIVLLVSRWPEPVIPVPRRIMPEDAAAWMAGTRHASKAGPA